LQKDINGIQWNPKKLKSDKMILTIDMTSGARELNCCNTHGLISYKTKLFMLDSSVSPVSLSLKGITYLK